MYVLAGSQSRIPRHRMFTSSENLPPFDLEMKLPGDDYTSGVSQFRSFPPTDNKPKLGLSSYCYDVLVTRRQYSAVAMFIKMLITVFYLCP